MLELTARVLISRSDQMRGIIRDRDSEFRVYYLKEMARQLAQALMETKGAVEVSEYMNPATGEIEMRGRVFVATNGERGSQRMTATEVRMRQEGKSSNMLDAMKYAMSGIPPDYFAQEYPPEPGASKYVPGAAFVMPEYNPSNGGTLTLDSIKKMMEKMDKKLGSNNPSPVDFLKERIVLKKSLEEAIQAKQLEIRADKEMKKSTRTKGEALPVVEVRVRKIQMPEGT